MKKVAVIISSLNSGGAERVAANLSIALSRFYELHLIVFDASSICYPHGGVLHDLHIPASSNSFLRCINLIRRIFKVKSIKKCNEISCSISFMNGPNLINALSGVGDRRIASVRIQMSKCVPSSRFPFTKALLRLIASRCYKIVAVSRGVEEDLQDVFCVPKEKLTTIYNPCDPVVLKNDVLSNHIRLPGGNVLITIGRLSIQKGQWHLIRAVAEVKKTIHDVKLYILGEGDLMEELQKLIHALRLDDNVQLLGYMKAPHACFKYSDVYVSSSEYEGMTNVLLEAMAFNMPCIATDCFSGSREILAPGTAVKEKLQDIEYAEYGVLTSVCGPGEFDAESPLTFEEHQLAQAIIRMLSDENMRNKYAEKSAQRVKDFSPAAIAANWEKLIST